MLTYLVPLLAFVSAVSIGAAVLLARSVGRREVRKRLQELQGRQGPQPAARAGAGAGPVRALGLVGRMFSVGAPSATLSAELARAGYHGGSAAAVYMGSKLVLLVAGLVGAAALMWELELLWASKLFLVCAGGVIPFFVPNIIVAGRRRKRSAEVRQHLPDAVDLLEICVSSGMGLDMAWNSVAEEVRGVSPVLADEMALTNLELHLGSPRAAALRHMAERTGAEEISSLVALLVQSERFGTSIADTLKAFAGSMRQDRGARAQETAEKMAVKLLFPMVLFIFPAVLIVLVGPAAIRLYAMQRW